MTLDRANPDRVAGAPDSIDDIFRQHYGQVFRLCLSLSGNRADAEDMAQEVFVAIINALSSFRAEARISTWIYRITLRVGGRWLARQRRRPQFTARPAACEQSLPIDLIRALTLLPIADRLVIMLVAVEGCSHAEAADVLAVPVGTVASRLHYARKKLARLLAS